MGFFEQLTYELTHINLGNIIAIAIIFYIPFYFSKRAESLFFHLFYFFIGAYMIFTSSDPRIIDMKTIIGLALVVPQIRFIIQFTKDTIFTIKMMSVNTYYFFVTIYYKILRFINWVRSIYIMFKSFFENFGNQQEQEQNKEKNHSYNEQEYQKYYEDFKKEKESSKQKQYEENKQSKHNNAKDDKFARFYNDSAYIVLGVNIDDDIQTIKRAYRKLVRQYHPDLNPSDTAFYNEITQHINLAWEKIEKYHN